MIQLILFLLIGAGLLLVLFALSRRAVPAERSATTLLEARQALDALQGMLPPSGALGRFLAEGDLAYITSCTPPNIQQLFMRERRRLAIFWAGQVHHSVRALRSFHLGQARFYAKLSLATEMELALSFTALLLICRALQIALYLGGLSPARPMLGRTARLVAKLCVVSATSFAFLESARGRGPNRERPEGNSALTATN